MTRSAYFILVLILGGSIGLNSLANDPFLPAQSAAAASLGVDTGTIGMTLGLYMIGVAVGQVLYGPVSDRFGRKPVFLFALAVYFAGGLTAALSEDLGGFAVARVLQGLGGAGGFILGPAIVRDTYEREQAARLMSYMMVVGGLAPIVGPLVGSMLLRYFDWRSIFYLAAIFVSFLALFATFFLKETLKNRNARAMHPGHLAAATKHVLSNRTFLAYTFCGGFGSTGFHVFLASAAAVLMVQYGQTRDELAVSFAFIMIGNVFGSFLGGKLVVRFGIERMMEIGVATMIVGAVPILAFMLAGVRDPMAVVVPFILYKFGHALLLGHSTAGALTPFGQLAGTASSVQGFIRQGLSAAAAFATGATIDAGPLPMGIGIVLCAVASLAVFAVYIRPSRPTRD